MKYFNEKDLKEIFSLFTSATDYEIDQIYDKKNKFYYFELADLDQEYSLTIDKRTFALDALRSVLYFLYSHGYEIKKSNENIDLNEILDYLITKV